MPNTTEHAKRQRQLPDELEVEVLLDVLFEHLTANAIIKLANVCKQWRTKINSYGATQWCLKWQQTMGAPLPTLESSEYFSSVKDLCLYAEKLAPLKEEEKNYVTENLPELSKNTNNTNRIFVAMRHADEGRSHKYEAYDDLDVRIVIFPLGRDPMLPVKIDINYRADLEERYSYYSSSISSNITGTYVTGYLAVTWGNPKHCVLNRAAVAVINDIVYGVGNWKIDDDYLYVTWPSDIVGFGEKHMHIGEVIAFENFRAEEEVAVMNDS
jgi:hypothetical protein